MKITNETATSLGEKLATLDLTVEEGVLLTSMLGHTDDEAEVEGFGHTDRPENYMKIEMEKVSVKSVLAPLPGPWKPGGDGYLIITMTN